jgi:hypothetical protein
MTFWDALEKLIVGDGKFDTYTGYAIPVFAVGCGVMGLAVLVLDRLLYSLQGKSILDLNYGSQVATTARLFCIWGLGAALGGYFSAAVEAAQFTRAACFAIGIGWPLVLPRLIASAAKKKEDEQIPEVA